MKTKNIFISMMCIALFSACRKDFDKVPDIANQGTVSGDVAQNGQQKLIYAPATCNNFHITLKNSCGVEIKVKKFQYKDGSNWPTENMLGVDGSDKIENTQSKFYTRDLGGIGNESTQFRVTYCHHIGGLVWGSDILQPTSSFTAQDNGSKTVTLTK